MKHKLLSRGPVLTLGLAAALAVSLAACGSDSSSVDPLGAKQKETTAGGSDTTGTPPATSTGPVASVVVSPKQVSVPAGYTTVIGAVALDAKGLRVINKRATWKSSDANIAVIVDTGVYAKAVGVAKVYATIDGKVDSATVTVTAGAVSPPTTGPTAPGVASFDLNAFVYGVLAGADSSRTESVAGAVVKLKRIGGISGDTLAVAVDAGSATSDATGIARFKGLPGGSYSVEVTPPAGSPYAAMQTGFAPPRSNPTNVRLTLRRK